jgi:dienelactone hydrolase
MSDEHIYGHLVQEYTVQRAREILGKRRAERAAVKTKADLAKLQRSVRRKLRRCFGPMPKRTPLNVRVVDTLDRKEYRIEKLIYDSRPDFPVTANLYVPNADGPFPAVLGTCGHAAEGKAYELYQAFPRQLCRMGYVVLIYDPISQGERMQFCALPKSRQPGGLCPDHNMMGNQMHLVGEFFGAWRTWDGMRSLDVLLKRPEVDRTRVGVTGNSGGGTMSTWLTGLDKRLTMAAPSCFVTSYLNNLENEEAQDAEQMPPMLLKNGLDMADFFVAYLPRPTLLLGQKNDFFDTRGLTGVYEELRRLYGIVGAADDVELFIGPTDHGYRIENREAMYRFFNRHAGVEATPREPKKLKADLPQTLHCTPKGQVQQQRPRPRAVYDFTAESAREVAAGRKPLAGKKLADAITNSLALPKRDGPPHYRVLRPRGEIAPRGPHRTVVMVETEPGIQAALHLFTDKPHFDLHEGKKAVVYLPHLSSLDEARDGAAPEPGRDERLFAVDPRGLGMLTPQACHRANFFAPYDADYMYATYGQMLGEPYSGRRVHDVLAALDLLESKGYRGMHLVGRGLGAVWATFAGVLHAAVSQVTLHNALLSYHELTQRPVYKWPLSSFVFGALRTFDLPDCLRELAKRKRLVLVDPWNGDMRKWRKDRVKTHLKELGLAGVRVKG